MHARSLDAFDRQVRAIAEGQWGAPTPCTEWDVRALVTHLVEEQLWAAPLLEGATLAEAGARVPADPLGDDAVAAWASSSAAARRSAGLPGVVERTVHLSYGDVPATAYLAQMTMDATVHSWDLARGLGHEVSLDPELVAFSWDEVQGTEDDLVASGLFAEPVPVPEDADLLTRLLAKVGRHP
jgi:uncharacterized protein (TIGR03086 family)